MSFVGSVLHWENTLKSKDYPLNEQSHFTSKSLHIHYQGNGDCKAAFWFSPRKLGDPTFCSLQIWRAKVVHGWIGRPRQAGNSALQMIVQAGHSAVPILMESNNCLAAVATLTFNLLLQSCQLIINLTAFSFQPQIGLHIPDNPR